MNAQDEILEALRELVRENMPKRLPDAALADETRLIEDLGYDSVSLIQLIVHIEERFGIVFEDEYLLVERIGRVADLSGYVYALIQQKGGG